MVRSRSLGPTLKMVFGFNERWGKRLIKDQAQGIEIFMGIRNDADAVAETALLELGIPRVNGFWRPSGSPEEIGPFTRIGIRNARGIVDDDLEMDWYECPWPVRREEWKHIDRPIFKTMDPIEVYRWGLPSLSPSYLLVPPLPQVKGWLIWRVQAPKTEPLSGVVRIVQGTYPGPLDIQEPGDQFEII